MCAPRRDVLLVESNAANALAVISRGVHRQKVWPVYLQVSGKQQ